MSLVFGQTSAGGSGTVTSVGLSAPASILSVSGSPVTTSGTLALSLATQTANTVWAGPTTGAAANPAFRALVGADIPGPTITPVSSNITLGNGMVYFVDTSSARSLALPDPATAGGVRFWLKDVSGLAATNNITITRFASEKIENTAANLVLQSDFGAWQFMSDGTNWWLL